MKNQSKLKKVGIELPLSMYAILDTKANLAGVPLSCLIKLLLVETMDSRGWTAAKLVSEVRDSDKISSLFQEYGKNIQS